MEKKIEGDITSAVVDVNPEMDRLEKTFKVLLRANQAKATTLRRIISPQVADLIEGVRLSNVGDNQLQAFSKLAMKIEKMIAWASDQDTKNKLSRKLRDVANSIVLQGSKDESTLDRHLAESIIQTIETPQEAYAPPEVELAEEVEVERPAISKAKTKSKGKRAEKEEKEKDEFEE